MTTQQGHPSLSPVRASALKMTPHTPSPNKNDNTALSSPSITITSLGSDSGYESDALSKSKSSRELPLRRRTSSAMSRSSKTSSTKRPKMDRRARTSGVFEGDVLFDPLGRSMSDLPPEDSLEGCKDPTPPQLFVTFSDSLLDRPAPYIRERVVSTPAFGFGFSIPTTAPKPFSESLETYSLNSPVPPPITEHSGRTPLAKPAYRKPSEDPSWTLDEPVKPVTEDHVKALYQTPNCNIEELNEEIPYNDSQELLIDSNISISDVPESSSQRPGQHLRSVSSPAAILSPVAESSPNVDQPIPFRSNAPSSLGRSQSTSAVPSRSIPMHVAEEPLAELPEFESERPWAGLNDLFLEATRVLSRPHSRSGSTDSAFLAPPPPKTASSTPPVTPVTAVPNLPSAQDDDDEAAAEDLASTLYDSAELTRSDRVTVKVVKAVEQGGLVALPEEGVKWGFLFFGLVGGMVLGSMLSRGRL